MALPRTGAYALTVVGQAPWHRHRLIVHAADDDSVHGVIALDRSAAPDCSPRGVDELPLWSPFVAPRGERGAFAVTIVVGAALPRTWRFVLWGAGDDTLVGVVDIGRRRTGVLARRIS